MMRLRLRTRPALSARYSWNRRISSDVAMSRDRFRNAANCLPLRIPLAIDVSVREEDAMTTQLLGGCACGAIRYACDVAPAAVFHCHCGDCQRSRMSTVALVPRTRPHPGPKDTF